MHHRLLLPLLLSISQALPARFDDLLVPGGWVEEEPRIPVKLPVSEIQATNGNNLLTRTSAEKIFTAAMDDCKSFISQGTLPEIYYSLRSLSSEGPTVFGVDEEADQESNDALRQFGQQLDENLNRYWVFEKLPLRNRNEDWKLITPSGAHEIGENIRQKFHMRHTGALCNEAPNYWG